MIDNVEFINKTTNDNIIDLLCLNKKYNIILNNKKVMVLNTNKDICDLRKLDGHIHSKYEYYTVVFNFFEYTLFNKNDSLYIIKEVINEFTKSFIQNLKDDYTLTKKNTIIFQGDHLDIKVVFYLVPSF